MSLSIKGLERIRIKGVGEDEDRDEDSGAWGSKVSVKLVVNVKVTGRGGAATAWTRFVERTPNGQRKIEGVFGIDFEECLLTALSNKPINV
ncbi:hypothetical protein L2E82_03306 [Cichorium intybus]|uniref:Uncharacterized protein n=1 Tax=Cichorium intybus TaxID=13427 RepID=A0ACB9H496_CICIN|nr:hypothetical protein L2E82_03306 [Cichorium intybus]